MAMIYFLLVAALVIFFSGVFTVKQQTALVIERLGRFHSVRHSGLQFKVPLIDRTAGRVTLKINQLDVLVETKTKDNVFVKVKISVQFKVLEDAIYDAFYKLQNPHEQITAYVFDTVRAEVPKMRLDDVFERKDDIALAIKRELEEAMTEYGYGILKALVTDIDPDQAVKNAMNHINAAERQKLAAEYEAESERIRIVARAKAEAESKRLQGQGIADQRREIARGLEESVDLLNKVGINSQEASALIVVTQHYDTLQQIGQHTNSNLILLPNAPTAANDMLSQMIASFSSSQMMGEKLKLNTTPIPPKTLDAQYADVSVKADQKK
jgi:regulator of protease activity HflC (stomatin/prohibitin superfamily)